MTGRGPDQVVALHEQVSEGVAALVDLEAWWAMLDTALRFHRYSRRNPVLMQAPSATRVAGFGT